MSKKAIYTLIYALITLIGGAMGYIKAGSIPSLVASSISGTLLLIFTVASMRNKPWGTYAALTLGFMLTGFFSFRLMTNPGIPAIAMTVVSSLYIYLTAREMFANQPSPSPCVLKVKSPCDAVDVKDLSCKK
ncbi:MAG: TMEM14 family protein [Chlamydiia bacterium]|nr:TMEM14 family protein [Chlamydiia bacterium]